MVKKFLLVSLLFLGLSSPALADKITREDVEKHLQAMSDLYNVDPVDIENIYEFSKAYMVDGGIYASHIYINDQKDPAVTSMDKEQSLKIIREMQDKYLKASARYEIEDFNLNDDGTEATVKYKLWHDATIEHIISPQETGQASFTSESECAETFIKTGTQVQGTKNLCIIKMKQSEPTRTYKKPQE